MWLDDVELDQEPSADEEVGADEEGEDDEDEESEDDASGDEGGLTDFIIDEDDEDDA